MTFFKTKTEEYQTAEPLWFKWEDGRYVESEEFKIVAYRYKVLYLFNRRVWGYPREFVSETDWITVNDLK